MMTYEVLVMGSKSEICPYGRKTCSKTSVESKMQSRVTHPEHCDLHTHHTGDWESLDR